MIKYKFKHEKLVGIESINHKSPNESIAEMLILKLLKAKGLITQNEYDKTVTLLKNEKTLNIKTN